MEKPFSHPLLFFNPSNSSMKIYILFFVSENRFEGQLLIQGPKTKR